MKTKAMRAAERRRRQRARRRARERRAAGTFADRPQWWQEGLVETPTEEIVTTLAGLNIQTDELRFREMAFTHGSPDALADAWETGATATGIWEDYVWMAAETLWRRWTPDLFCVDLFVDQHLPIDAFRDDAPANREEAERHWRMAQAVMDLVAPRDGEPRLELLDQLTEHSTVDIGWWLGEIPFALARFGMVEEAAELCARMAAVREVENFLGDRAVILAEAGRREDALRQVEKNLVRFPEDAWVRIKAGDVYRELGDAAAAEAAYRHALEMTPADEPSFDRDGAVERLICILDETGRAQEADALIASEKTRAVALGTVGDSSGGEDAELSEAMDTPPSPEYVPSPSAVSPGTMVRRGPKVGRNDLCPCGSGKKFKRCCGS
jgi:tetratricopeptide (TPR) repeat protein